MRLQELTKYPLADIGFQKSMILLTRPDLLPGSNLPESLRQSAADAFGVVLATVSKVTAAKIQYFNEQLLVDVTGENGAFARLAYANTVGGITVRPINIPSFDPDVRYLATLTKDSATVTINNGIQFFSGQDTITFRLIQDDSGDSIVADITQLTFDVTPVVEVSSPLDSRTIELEDRILSIRAGALMAHAQLYIGGETATPKSPEESIQDAIGFAKADVAGVPGVNDGQQGPAGDDRKLFLMEDVDLLAAVSVTRPATEQPPPVPEIDLLKLPQRDLDFNRLFTESRTILDSSLVVESYRAAKDVLSGVSLNVLSDAVNSLGANPSDQEAMAYVDRFAVAAENQAMTSLSVYRPKAEGEPLRFKYTNPNTFRRSLEKGLGSAEKVAEFERGILVKPQDIISGAIDRSLPNDHAMLVGTVQLATFGAKDWMEPEDQIRVINPYIVAGSVQAKILVLAAEAAVLASIGKNQAEQNLISYVPGLRRLEEDIRRKQKLTFASSTYAAFDRDDKSSAGQISGFNSVAALYSYGFANVGSHVDTTDFRLGLAAGQIEGAKAVYEALRQGIREIDLPPLQAGASIDDILRAIEAAARKINAFVDNLNSLVTELRGTVARLEGELASTMRKLGGAADGIRTFAFAGTGFLVGGPVGAAIGGLVSLF